MENDEFSGKGAVEQDAPGESTNESLRGQLGHRDQNPLIKNSDSDFPEPGNNEEHTGEAREKSVQRGPESPERDAVNQDPGHGQKRNQNDERDDLSAA